MQARIAEINPQAQVEVLQTFYSSECADELVRTDYDYIIDAIDTVSSKIDLVINAQNKNIPIISSMGTGNKLDPTRLEISDIYATSVCPLARVMRRELRKRGVKELTVVYSQEEPAGPGKTGCLPCDSSHIVSQYNTDGNASRRETPGSVSFVPSVAGLLMASKVVRDLISKGS
jgi:tRNA A37 threonylcarbamoyladenosine dehydratase